MRAVKLGSVELEVNRFPYRVSKERSQQASQKKKETWPTSDAERSSCNKIIRPDLDIIYQRARAHSLDLEQRVEFPPLPYPSSHIEILQWA